MMIREHKLRKKQSFPLAQQYYAKFSACDAIEGCSLIHRRRRWGRYYFQIISQKIFEKKAQAIILMAISLVYNILSYDGLHFKPSYSRHIALIFVG